MSDHIELFKEKAKLVSAQVTEVASMDEAYRFVVELCDKKEACQLMMSGCGEAVSDPAQDMCDTKQRKVVAAPNLEQADFDKLAELCAAQDFDCIQSGMRKHLAGIDIGFTVCQGGIAETGTLLLDSNDEEVRLATMVAEHHVAVLPKSAIKGDSYDMEQALTDRLGNGPSYTAMITGPSRTADIERVLALGVHGPLELHILLLEA
ncbi:L-lactate dehydrogenase complex protein LldG [Paucidesulfovibrio gracilis DSM 16080]|uniref:L-lactate dehydrogenase complex protein LldG n=1 Tax=Paucidesulfovibrio gracilis DSM 16080 TaxID=1121449 RepID=A0A1T4XZQ4_9BACT|nr:lactate utilization protein [Paucidesulfovibrio gracilis]SKA95010.1 L-lactate dehydrogenase complex protein LldG [Paucidesulfovibrio gracilis DSM 16080]